MCVLLSTITACNTNQTVQRLVIEEGNEDSGSVEENKEDGSDTEISGAQYVGEYNSYDIDEPELEIEQQEDGTFIIQIGIFRLIQLYNCIVLFSTSNDTQFFTLNETILG